MQAKIQRNVLKAVLRFADKNDIRYYLNGIYLQMARGTIRLVATDGSALALWQSPTPGEENIGEIRGMIIPHDVIKSILAWKGPGKVANDIPVTITPNGESEYCVDWCNNALMFQPIDGRFPDYARVIPGLPTAGMQDETGAAQFNPEYLCRALDAARDIHGKDKFTLSGIAHRGSNDAGVIMIDSNFFAVIMPMRQDQPTPDQWQFGREDLFTEVKESEVSETQAEAVAA